ncbi:MAG: efflux RND transporter periplasmic adaptor subunit [Gammaproteobacteria bacterium]
MQFFPMPLRSPVVALCLLALLALGACMRGDNGNGAPGGGGPGGMPPAPVTLAEPVREDVLRRADYTTRVRGLQEVEVRARVGGILEERLFEEGAAVEVGQPLFRIEQAPYRIALQRARAEQANARAALNQAEREWRRVAGLFEQRAISARERDLALSNKELAEARLALAEANVAQAELELGYATVRAPADGVTGLEQLTAGNLVAAGTFLTTVTTLDPVQLRFAMPADDAASRRALEARKRDGMSVEALRADGSVYPHLGRLQFMASTVEPATGNVPAQAVFANPDGELRPGETLRVRLAVAWLEDALLVPATAVAQGLHGARLFVAGEGNVAVAREVELGPVIDGRQVILGGLEPGDWVIANGQVGVRDGAPIAPQEPGQPRVPDAEAEAR